MEVELNNTKLKVYEDGRVERFWRNKYWREVENTPICYGYNTIACNRRRYRRHRIIAMCYLGLDINNTDLVVDHIDHNTINNNVNNLRVVSQQQNQFNRSNVKGYRKEKGKWRAKITYNDKNYHLGYYKTEEEAREAYLEAKRQFHII